MVPHQKHLIIHFNLIFQILVKKMGPKKSRKKAKGQVDDEFENQNAMSKWAQALEDNVDGQEPDAQQLYINPSKVIFDFDFANQRALDLSKQETPKPQRDKYADFTPQELEQLKKVKQKAKFDKEIKNQIKNEKKKQRQKEAQAQKIIEKAEKQKEAEQIKKVEEEIKKNKKQEGSPWTIPAGLFLFLVVMFFLQYKKQIHERLSKFQSQEIDFYEILEADQSLTQKQLKARYKKLVMKYHPDRNPDCQNCKQKFDNIMRAWEVLGEPEKRKQYDQNSGFIAQLKSSSATLTPQNYQFLVSQSSYLWIIQVFDSTNTYSRYFAQFWEELVTNYGDFVKFGRVDIWHQTDMSSYIPYKFQVFPSVYFLDQGYSQICSFNFQRPTEGLKKCIQQALGKHEQKTIPQVPTKAYNKQNKIEVYLDGRLRANTKMKAYNRIMDKYFTYYFVESETFKKKAVLFFQNKEYTYNFTENSKKVFEEYALFLQNFVIQQISTCAFLSYCEEHKCILVLNSSKISQVKLRLPLRQENPEKLPVFVLTDQTAEFDDKINQLKQPYENFEIGAYMGGRIDLGYANEADWLIPEEGQRFDISCKIIGWRESLWLLLKKVADIFSSSRST